MNDMHSKLYNQCATSLKFNPGILINSDKDSDSCDDEDWYGKPEHRVNQTYPLTNVNSQEGRLEENRQYKDPRKMKQAHLDWSSIDPHQRNLAQTTSGPQNLMKRTANKRRRN